MSERKPLPMIKSCNYFPPLQGPFTAMQQSRAEQRAWMENPKESAPLESLKQILQPSSIFRDGEGSLRKVQVAKKSTSGLRYDYLNMIRRKRHIEDIQNEPQLQQRKIRPVKVPLRFSKLQQSLEAIAAQKELEKSQKSIAQQKALEESLAAKKSIAKQKAREKSLAKQKALEKSLAAQQSIAKQKVLEESLEESDEDHPYGLRRSRKGTNFYEEVELEHDSDSESTWNLIFKKK